VEQIGLHGVPSMEKGIKSGTTSIHVSNIINKKITPIGYSPLGVYFILNC
jgi:hypothetical protein